MKINYLDIIQEICDELNVTWAEAEEIYAAAQDDAADQARDLRDGF